MIDNYTLIGLPGDYPIYIYTLSDETGIRYIGQSVDPAKRFSTHKTLSKTGKDNTPRGQWIRESFGRIAMNVVEKCNPDRSNERERHWVNYCRQQGCDLVNGSFGICNEPVSKPTKTEFVPEGTPKVIRKYSGFVWFDNGEVLSAEEAERHRPGARGRPKNA